MKTLILGIGNTLLSDEGAGVHAVRRLEAEAAVPGVRFLDGGTLSFTLAGAVEDAQHLIVIDAAELAASPGTVRLFEGEQMDAFVGGHRKRSVHEVGLADLLAMASLSGRMPARRALIGIQPQLVAWGEEPSPPVARAIATACAMATDLLAAWRT